MLGPRKQILWAKHIPLPYNPYPLFQAKKHSLGGEKNNLAIFVPILLSQRNVKEVDKEDGEKKKGGKDLNLSNGKDLHGKGLAAFQHPVKVRVLFCKIHQKYFFVFRCPGSN